jgi:hypothetical protein
MWRQETWVVVDISPGKATASEERIVEREKTPF